MLASHGTISGKGCASDHWREKRGRPEVGMITFGASGPIKKVQAEKGFTVDAVVAAARRELSRRRLDHSTGGMIIQRMLQWYNKQSC